jgi:hypothetical protein
MGFRLHDRRAAQRPANCDTAVCPKCRVGIIEFNERYRVVLVTGKTASIPAWVCDRPECRFERAARRDSDQIPLHNPSVDPRARSSRPLTKARDVLHRAGKTLSKSLRRKKSRH